MTGSVIIEAALAVAIEAWFREMVALSPRSSLGAFESGYAQRTNWDDVLIRRIDTRDFRAPDLLRTCTELQQRLLLRRHLLRRYMPKTERVGFTDVPAEGEAIHRTRADLAKAEGLSLYQYKRELVKALDNVGRALEGRQDRRAA